MCVCVCAAAADALGAKRVGEERGYAEAKADAVIAVVKRLAQAKFLRQKPPFFFLSCERFPFPLFTPGRSRILCHGNVVPIVGRILRRRRKPASYGSGALWREETFFMDWHGWGHSTHTQANSRKGRPTPRERETDFTSVIAKPPSTTPPLPLYHVCSCCLSVLLFR